ncbi:MAG: 3-isopropylmalate dehydratase large subunit, partial [Candidatus Hydrothermarchaeota archaeon]
MTIAEKILAKASGRKKVEPGEIVETSVDYVMVNDITGLPAFEVFEKLEAEPLGEKIVLIQ